MDLSAFLTALTNLVAAVLSASSNYMSVQGQQVRVAISAATVLKAVAGRVAVVTVTTAGSAAGAIYDASQTGVTTSPIYVIPNTVGVVVVNLPTNNGIVVAPGTSQVVTVSYS